MAKKRYKPEDVVGLLRQVEVSQGQGMTMAADAIWQLGFSEVTPSCSWRKEYGGMSGDQLRRLKKLERENERLCRAASDLTALAIADVFRRERDEAQADQKLRASMLSAPNQSFTVCRAGAESS